MIPTIGLMVAAYIVLRCVEIATKVQTEYNSAAGGTVTRILALLVLAFAIFCGVDLMQAGMKGRGVRLP